MKNALQTSLLVNTHTSPSNTLSIFGEIKPWTQETVSQEAFEGRVTSIGSHRVTPVDEKGGFRGSHQNRFRGHTMGCFRHTSSASPLQALQALQAHPRCPRGDIWQTESVETCSVPRRTAARSFPEQKTERSTHANQQNKKNCQTKTANTCQPHFMRHSKTKKNSTNNTCDTLGSPF